MTVRDAEGRSGSDERRRGSGRRLRFEALVAVGDAEGGSGFEAESIDVSPDGMRLRTAYLPELGDRLLCRFEGVGTEVLAEGEVIWRDEQDRGGEFGLRFMRLDAAAQDRLRAMCAPEESENAAENGPIPMGARVRLHIEGLASPMKARVRETATGEVRVGSNLEFLRVGQKLDLEDVDQKGKRGVVIDHVAVEVDPETNVPQLVVSLRYPDARPVVMPARAAAQPTLISPRPEPAVVKAAAAAPVVDEESAASAEDDGEISVVAEDEERAAVAKMHSGLRGVGQKAAAMSRTMGGKMAPAFATFAARSKEKLGAALALVAKKRSERLASKQDGGPRRTTAPPPKGALTSEGRRLVRDDEPAQSAGEPAPRRKLGRSAIVGGLLGVLAVIGVVSAARLFGGAAPSAGAEAPAAALSAPALAAAAPAALPGADGVVTTNVPLFGATPLSTTEPVPTAPPDAPPLGAAGDPATDPLLAAAAGAVEGAGDEGDEVGTSPDGEGDEGDGAGVTEWGSGNVRNAVVLKLKMDGEVERIDGAKGAMGFTISVPGRRALSTGADLARKDKRIAAVDVVNSAHGAEITLRFKDGVPAYLAKANGARVEIAIGDAGKKAGVAKKADAKKADKKVASKADPKKSKAKDKGGKKAAKPKK